MKKILVAMDSMKGCLGSQEASQAIAEGLKRSNPDIEVVCVPVADGGEGMVEMVASALPDADWYSCKVIGPLGDETEARWLKHTDNAYMEFAAASGLPLIENDKRNPLLTSSYGVGQMIDDAIKVGINDIMLGLGGSATVDAGLGALQALGLMLLDAEGRELPPPYIGGMHAKVADIELTDEFKGKIARLRLTLLCDVDAPFTGDRGAARVFGPQKGADEKGVEILEAGMENIRRLIIEKTGIDLSQVPGSGAAGGAAGGMMALVGAQIKKGAPALLDIEGFDQKLSDVDLIITGEGSSDRQTLMGKLPFEILQRGRKNNIPVWLVAGLISDEEELLEAGFARLICINSPEIVRRSNAVGKNAMDSGVAAARLRSIF